MTEKKRPVAAVLRGISDAIGSAVAVLFATLFAMIAPIMIASLVRKASEGLLERGYVIATVVLVLVCAALFYVALTFITPENARGRGGKVARGFAWGFSGAVAMVWVYFFGLFSYALMRLDVMHYALRGSGDALSDLTDAYLWYFLELVPLLDINDAFGWKQPDVDLTGGWSGIILLFFRIVMVFQVFSLAKTLLDASKPQEGSPTAAKQAHPAPL